MLVIVDYGLGNLRSILNKLRRLEIDAVLSSDPDKIVKADRLILPGVGFFAAGMENLHKYNLIEVLQEKVVREKVPVLGICLGMQLFAGFSEEGNSKGLGWIDGEITKFNFEEHSLKLKVPHVGWNTIKVRNTSALVANLEEDSRFYFTHSYFFNCFDQRDNCAETNYGIDFTSVVVKDNIYGTQFHPEKSHQFGIKIIQNFVNLT